MATSKEDIKEWIDRGKKNGASHVIVVCDSYDYEDYPVYVQPNESPQEKIKDIGQQSMQRVMEVYSLLGDTDVQLNQLRAYNLGSQ